MKGNVVSIRLNKEIITFIDKICGLSQVDRSTVIQRMIDYFWIRMVIFKDYEAYPPIEQIKRDINWSANGVNSKKVNIRVDESTLKFIDKIAEKNNNSRSEIIRNIIEFFIITTAIDFKQHELKKT